MSITSSTNTISYQGNGVTTVFPFPFLVFEAAHLVVSRLVIATDTIDKIYNGSEYTIAGLNVISGGSITLLGTPLSDLYRIVITRLVPYTQELDINNQGGFHPDNVEKALDLIVMQIQQTFTEASTINVTAANVGLTPTGDIIAVNLQDAIAELDSEKVSVSNLSESIDDRVSTLLVEGTGITLNYDDGAGTLTISVGSLTAADIDFTPAGALAATDIQAALVELDTEKVAIASLSELIDDRINSLFVAGVNIQLNYDDTANTFTVSATSGAGATVSDGDYGDIVVSGTGTIFTIDPTVLTTFGRTVTTAADAAAGRAALGVDTIAIPYVIDGAGATITVGNKGGLYIPFAVTITGWTILETSGNAGAIVVDIWKDSYANHPPTVADTIAGTEKPTIVATGEKGQDLSLSSFTGAIAAGSIIYFNVDSVTTCRRVTVTLHGVRG